MQKAYTKSIPPRYIERSTTTLLFTPWRKTPLPPHTKSAVFLNPANPPSPTHMGWGLGGGIGANV